MSVLTVRFNEYSVTVTPETRVWPKLDWTFDMEIGQSLRLSLSWSNGLLHWKHLETQYPLILNQSPIVEFPGFFRVTHQAKKRFNPQFRGITVVGRVTALEFTGNLEEMWREFEKHHGHRVVCMMRLGLGGRSCQAYLGRAQHIETNNDDERVYTWIPQEEEKEKKMGTTTTGFPSPRTQDDWETHAREAWELAQIKCVQKPMEENPIDNDTFENNHRALPVLFRATDKEVQWQFFNLRGGFVESAYVPWTGLPLKPQRRSLRPTGTTKANGMEMQLKLTPDMSATIEYGSLNESGDEEIIVVTRVILRVSHYSRTLVHMGEGVPPNTV